MGKKSGETKAEDFKFINIDQLKVSPTNPRKSFVNQEIDDLAKSIGEKGVLQPLLVRVLGTGYEIIAGERRFRSSQIAGLKEIPCRVMELTDQQVLEVQVIENMQRADLSPLEEAQGYKELHETHGYDWAELARKIGKSKNYIYNRLKLLSLIPEFQKALLEGKITDGNKVAAVCNVYVPNFNLSWAEQIIRVQDPEDQKKLYESITDGSMTDYNSIVDLDSVKELIEDTFLLQLKKAPFPVKDAKLTGGPCGVCVKRTGANPDLFGESAGKTDSCQDPACWAVKKQENEANISSKFQKHIDAGRKVIIGEAAAAILDHLGYSKSEYSLLSSSSHEFKGSTTWEDALKGTEYKPVMVVDGSGKAIELVKNSIAIKHVPKKLLTEEKHGETPEQTKKRKEKEEAAAKHKEIEEKAAEDSLIQIMPDLLKEIDSVDFNKKEFVSFIMERVEEFGYGSNRIPETIEKIVFKGKTPSVTKSDAKTLRRIMVFTMLDGEVDYTNEKGGLVALLNFTGLMTKFKQLIKDNLKEVPAGEKETKKGKAKK